MAGIPFTIGRDITLDLSDPVQGIVRFAIRTGVTFTPVFESLKSKGLDGQPRHAEIPDGHRIAVDTDRADSRLDDYFCQKEENYFNGVADPNITFTETITEVSGAVSVYRYTDVAIKLTNGGTFRGNTIATMALEGMAARKRKVQ